MGAGASTRAMGQLPDGHFNYQARLDLLAQSFGQMQVLSRFSQGSKAELGGAGGLGRISLLSHANSNCSDRRCFATTFAHNAEVIPALLSHSQAGDGIRLQCTAMINSFGNFLSRFPIRWKVSGVGVAIFVDVSRVLWAIGMVLVMN